MSTETLFQRPISPTERLYLATARNFSHLLIHLVVEGVGLIQKEAVQRALAEVSIAMPGTRLRLAGKQWIGDGATPRVIERPIEGDLTAEIDRSLQHAPMFNARDGYTCDVLLLHSHLHTFVVFRALHAVMDGKGVMLWAEAVFSTLRNESVKPATSPMTDDAWLASLRAPTVTPPARGPAYAGPQRSDASPDARKFHSAHCVLKTSHPATVAKLCTGVQAVLIRDADSKGRVMVPVDIRPNLPPEHQRSSANLTLPLFLQLERGTAWQTYAGRLLADLDAGNHLVYREAYRLHSLLPQFLLSWMMKTIWGKQTQQGKYLASSILSHMGRANLKDFSTEFFQATLVMSVPNIAPMAPFALTIMENVVSDEEVHTAICLVTSKALYAQPLTLLHEVIEKSGFLVPQAGAAPVVPPTIHFDDSIHALHQLFERSVKKRPKAPCLVFNGVTIDYETTNKRANQIAHYLLLQGLQRGDFVGAGLLRSFDLVMVILAIMKAGGAYLPMDPETPADRLEHFINDSGAQWVLTKREHEHLFTRARNRVLLDKLDKAIAAQPPTNPDLSIGGNDTAYLLYTSGSTGAPKGAVNTHAGVVNQFEDLNLRARLTSNDISIFRTPIGFDGTLLEIMAALQVGASLVIVPPAKHSDARFVLDLVRERNVTFFSTVPSILERLLDELGNEPLSLRTFLLVGEAFSQTLWDRILECVPNARVLNLYGPAEAAIISTGFTTDDAPHSCNGVGSVPIGGPIINMQAWVVDHRLNPLPPGEVGELLIAGVGVGKGYWNRAELTAQRFFPHPYAPESGFQAYRTGDLCKVMPCGNLLFVGRNDQQVKIRGVRIELGEIEHYIKSIDWVHQAAVLVRKSHGRDVLVAFLSVTQDCTEAQKQSIRPALEEKLPHYMIPTIFQYLEQLPLNANEKIDRKALKNFAFEEESAVDPDWSDDDRRMANLWHKVLGIPVAPDSNFFMLGGDSVLALKLIRQIEAEFGLAVEPQSLFENGNFAAFTSGVLASVEAGA